jgi:hypothetical protein
MKKKQDFIIILLINSGMIMKSTVNNVTTAQAGVTPNFQTLPKDQSKK